MKLKKSKTYLVNIIEHEGDYPHIYRVAKSIHVAKVLLHKYIAELENQFCKEDIHIEQEDVDMGHPTLKEKWFIKLKIPFGGSVTCEIHEIYEMSLQNT